MNKKIILMILMMALSLLLFPVVMAKPGQLKTNNKFEYFELIVSGQGSGINERSWYTPPNVDPLQNKTVHTRGGEWNPGEIVTLTVGGETYSAISTPISLTYTTSFDLNTVRNDDGSIKRVNINLIDVVTVYDEGTPIGELILKLKSSIVPTRTPIYTGTISGYGTGELEGLKISGMDLGVIGSGLFMRNGTITNWPF